MLTMPVSRAVGTALITWAGGTLAPVWIFAIRVPVGSIDLSPVDTPGVRVAGFDVVVPPIARWNELSVGIATTGGAFAAGLAATTLATIFASGFTGSGVG